MRKIKRTIEVSFLSLKKIKLICILILFVSFTYASNKNEFVSIDTYVIQGQTVKGTVKDVNGQPLIGANIIEKGTSNGTQTDFDGNFNITVSDANAILVVSYLGYLNLEMPLNGQVNVDLVLQEDASQLDEVVIVGYGTQRKEEVTSAITRVTVEDFNGGNVNDANQLLQGKVAGLNITRVGGDPSQPFAIRLRGLSTFGANAQPLVIIDGVIGGSIDAVDPSDIASINVLKDASAGAIYGTRGSSGVIIITTKSGKGKSKPELEYRGYVALESLGNVINIANREEFLAVGGLDLGSDTDWLEEVTRTGVTNVHNLSYSGSSDNGLNYRASINYRDVNAIVPGTGFQQLNARLNFTQRFFDDKLKVTGIISNTDRKSNIGFAQTLRYALTFNPTAPIFNDDGTYFQPAVQDVYNPVAINDLALRDEDRSVLLSNFKADLEVVDNLTVSANYSSQVTNILEGEFWPSNLRWNGVTNNGAATRRSWRNTSNLFELTANYRGEVNDFNYEVLGGYSYQELDFQTVQAANSDFITDEVGYNNLGLGLGITDLRDAFVFSNRQEAKLSSVFGRFNLNYKNTAFLSASVRSEESSRFGANNRRGTFWAVSGGINLNQIIDVPAIDQLKLRAGYGVTGNEPSQRLAFLQTLNSVGSGFINSEFVTAIGPTSNPNPDLKWEEKGEFNIGLDFSLLNSRLSGSFDYFNRTTSDLLNIVAVSSPPNIFEETLLNVGELETNGFEAQINYAVIQGDDFSWDFGGNIGTFKTTLVEWNGQEDGFTEFRGNFGAPGLNGTEPIIVEEGAELGQIRAGIFAGYNDSGQTLIINQETGEATTDRELDRDGVVVGNGLPDFTFGINNSFKYKNWDLNFFLRGAVGHSLVNIQRAYWEHPTLSGRQNFVRTKFFNPDDAEQDAYHSGHVEKADFLRLDNATLGYNVNLPENSLIQDLRVYISANNLFTITGYSGSDPEVRYSDPGPIADNDTRRTFGGDILVPGIERRASYSPTTAITFGINIKL